MARTLKAPGALAASFREQILNGELRDGDSLPSERDIVERMGVGRSSVREALRLLEADGLIQTRPGRNGGAVVQRPTTRIMARSIEMLVRGRRIPFATILETREALEPFGARLAALHRTPNDLCSIDEATRQLEDSLDDLKSYLDANLKWHMAVMEASHNELLIGFMHAVSTVIYAATAVENFNTLETRYAVAKAHRRVDSAIRSADADAARRRMERHVRAYSHAVTLCAPSGITVV